MSMTMEPEKPYYEPTIRLCFKATMYARVAVCVLGVAILCHLVSTGSSYWIAGELGGQVVWHEGLWQSCYIKPLDTWVCVSYVLDHHINTVPGWFKASQTMAILAIVSSVPAAMTMLLYTLLPTLGGRKVASVLSVVLCITSGVFVLTAVIVFATLYPLLPDHATQDVHFHWSFGVDITAAILFFIPPALLIVDMRKSLLWIV
ncbi:uncharacterized protein [Haliotis cracherodii]|uniref:uncharacterized protein n=1 Tax=Haliotis cracherodii TaxID=6455 RepID=UPI0039E7EABA